MMIGAGQTWTEFILLLGGTSDAPAAAADRNNNQHHKGFEFLVWRN